MMKVYRIEISSWTSSFRYPNVISGYQPTLLVPPLSTVLGLINACAGNYIDHHQLEIGYYFEYGAASTDLETIYQVGLTGKGTPDNKMKSNVLQREFLYDCKLFLYLKEEKLVEYFRNPRFQILLGRSNDLASVEGIEVRELQEMNTASRIKGQIVPFSGHYLPGVIQALPVYFTDTLPRKNLGTQAFSVIPYQMGDFPTNIHAFEDTIKDRKIDIYFHHLNFDRNE